MKNLFKRIGVSIKDIISSFKSSTKRQKRRTVLSIFSIILGSVIIAFGSSIFLISDGIPAGGLSGAGVVIQYLAPSFNIELFVMIASWTFFFIGWVFLGTKFIAKTLISTIVFPLALFGFAHIPFFVEMAEYFHATATTFVVDGVPITVVNNVQILLNGLFGGALVGVGVSLTFIGGGSSGGVDVLYFIIAKYLRVKQSISSFVIDSVVLLAGIIITAVKKDAEIIRPLIGIVSVLVGAIMIEYFYIRRNSAYCAEIISSKWEEINRFIQEDIGRGTTLLEVRGGWSDAKKVMIRAVFDQNDYQAIRTKISQVDPLAFVTYTRTEAVFGEGFTPHKPTGIYSTNNQENQDKNG